MVIQTNLLAWNKKMKKKIRIRIKIDEMVRLIYRKTTLKKYGILDVLIDKIRYEMKKRISWKVIWKVYEKIKNKV